MSMAASDICQGLRIIFSAVMSTVFNSNNGRHSMPKMNAEVSAVVFTECHVLIEPDLLVTFH